MPLHLARSGPHVSVTSEAWKGGADWAQNLVEILLNQQNNPSMPISDGKICNFPFTLNKL